MPENEPTQTISKRYATPISESSLPLNNERRIYIDGSCCSMQYQCKRAEDMLDYFVDMMKWLEPNEFIIGAAGWCDPDSLIITRLEYAPSGVVAWLAGGGDSVRQTVNIQIATSLGKRKLVQFVVQAAGIAGDLAIVTAEGDQVTVGFNTGGGVEPEPEPLITVHPSSLTFPLTAAGTGQASQTVIVKNEGDVTAFIRAIDLEGPFTQHNPGVYKLVPGGFTQVTITYKPQTVGSHTGSMSIDIGEGFKEYATFTGTAHSGTRLVTSGNQLVRPGGETVRLKSINWFGAESEVYAPHGLWARNYRDIIDQIAAMGFNAVRLPFSGDLCDESRNVTSGVINYALNPELIDKTAIQVFDEVISYINQKQLYIILDHHRCFAGDGADGSPIAEGYGLDEWKNSWRFMVNRYKNLEFLLGADLHNEPYKLEWDTWASYAEDAGNTILGLAPNWLIFVEGVGRYGESNYWWGGELSGVRDRPVQLIMQNRLVYSVHEYGISVGEQPWLAKDSTLPGGWPYNLYPVWHDHWGFIFEEGIAPIWIGEVGGKFGVDGNSQVISDTNGQFERQWIYHLQRYMDGYYDGSSTRQLSADKQGISFAYWSLNPNSGDTGGLLQDDWTTEQSFKLELIGMMLHGMTLPDVFGLTPLDYSEVDDSSQIILSQNGFNFAINLTNFKDAMRMRIYEAGEVHFFALDVDVPARYKGQTWVRVPGEDKTIRIARADDSNILTTGGSDTVTIAKANLPATVLSVTGAAASVDLGTKTTSTSGNHTHTAKMGGDNNGVRNASGSAAITSSAILTSEGIDGTGQILGSGDHNHTFNIGAHSHSVAGQTENMGSGTALDVTNEYVTLAAWYRVS